MERAPESCHNQWIVRQLHFEKIILRAEFTIWVFYLFLTDTAAGNRAVEHQGFAQFPNAFEYLVSVEVRSKTGCGLVNF